MLPEKMQGLGAAAAVNRENTLLGPRSDQNPGIRPEFFAVITVKLLDAHDGIQLETFPWAQETLRHEP